MSPRRANSDVPDTRGEASRQALILSALESFGHSGFDAASIRDISDRAGQNVAAINYHFGSKEGLYLAVAELLAKVVGASTNAQLEPALAYLASAKRSTAKTEEHLGNLLRALVFSLFANARTSASILFVMREQASPTAAFDVIFEKLIKPMHETITALVADRVGLAATDVESVLRAHACIGQCIGFKAAKAAVQKRTGWASADDPGVEKVQLIADIVVEHALAALRSAAASKRRGA